MAKTARRNDVTVLPPSMELAAKCPVVPGNSVKAPSWRQAEAELNAMTDGYDERLKGELDKLAQSIEWADAAPGEQNELLSQAFRICHNIKGQAGTFDWDLVTLIARPLSNFFQQLDVATAKDWTVIRQYLALMQVIVAQGVKGKAEPLASKIFAKLKAIEQATAD